MKHFVQASEAKIPDYTRRKPSVPETPPKKSSYVGEREALVEKYFMSLSEASEKWAARFKTMGLTRLHLPSICQKMTADDSKIVTATEIHDWFFNKPSMYSDLWKIERKKVAVFNSVLDRVEAAIQAGEVFTVQSYVSPFVPRTMDRYDDNTSDDSLKNPRHIDFTPVMRAQLKECFALGDGVTIRDIHRHLVHQHEEAASILPLQMVKRWFNEESGTQRVRKELLGAFLGAAISLMENRNVEPTHQTGLSNFQPELPQVR